MVINRAENKAWRIKEGDVMNVKKKLKRRVTPKRPWATTLSFRQMILYYLNKED